MKEIRNLDDFNALVYAGKCPQGMMINLGYNQLGPEGAAHIKEALMSGKCPQWMTIDL